MFLLHDIIMLASQFLILWQQKFPANEKSPQVRFEPATSWTSVWYLLTCSTIRFNKFYSHKEKESNVSTLGPGPHGSISCFNIGAVFSITRFYHFSHVKCRHIYIPLGGSRHGAFRQFLAAIACFSFTCFWHGSLDYILAWTAFNLVIVGGEALAYHVVNKKSVKEFEVHIIKFFTNTQIDNNGNIGIRGFTMWKQRNPAMKCHPSEHWTWDPSHSVLMLASLSYQDMCYLGDS